MKLRYELKEIHLLARSLNSHEFENLIGRNLGYPETVDKPQIAVIIKAESQ